ncbi:MAG TPA: sigma-54 dependent transcriptional regulator [Kofleriaceae bacterium]|nr:sigma-54 dependent transcriptional regulator [Kofleriaceae bacterium]
MTRVAIVDDDPLILDAWRLALRDRYDVVTFRNPLEAERFFEHERIDVALLDLQMPGRDGLALLRAIKRVQPDAEVVIVTGHGSIAIAIEATRAGAHDFVLKPVEDPEALVLRIERVLERRRLAADNAALRTAVSALGPERTLIGDSEPMQRLRALIERVADSPAPVLIVGESGTGKELVSRALHAHSNRSKRPFVPVNCAAIADDLIDNELFGHERGAFTGASTAHKGLFEAAHGGVLFLDEIGDVPPSTQVRLLRALQEGEVRPVGATTSRTVDVRVVAATNVDLARAMDEGRFRRDLFFRLSTFRLELPPLRARGDDVLQLADRLMQRAAARAERPARRLGDEVIAALRAYPWPGNVRELGNVIEYAVTLCDGEVIEPIHLPSHVLVAPAAPVGDGGLLDDLVYKTARERFERRYLRELMQASQANLSEAARRSGVDRSNLRRLLRRHGLDTTGAPVGTPEPVDELD